VVPSVMGVVGLLGRTAQHRTSRAKRPAARMSRRFKALRSAACRHAAPPTCFLPMPLHLAAATSARSYNRFRIYRMPRLAVGRAKSMVWAIRPGGGEHCGCSPWQMDFRGGLRPFRSRMQRAAFAIRASIDVLGKFAATRSCSDRSAQSVGTGDGPPADGGRRCESRRQCGNAPDGIAEQGKGSEFHAAGRPRQQSLVAIARKVGGQIVDSKGEHVMKQVPIAGAVLLGLFGMAYAVEYWLRQRSSGPSATKRVHVEQWENEGGALAPAHGTTKTSQVPH